MKLLPYLGITCNLYEVWINLPRNILGLIVSKGYYEGVNGGKPIINSILKLGYTLIRLYEIRVIHLGGFGRLNSHN